MGSGRFREEKILLPLLLMGFMEIFEREFVFSVVNIYLYLHVRNMRMPLVSFCMVPRIHPFRLSCEI